MMEADLTYFDMRHVSTPDGPGGDTHARVSIMGDKGSLAARPSGCSTLYEVFLHGMKASSDGPCLGFRPTPRLGLCLPQLLDGSRHGQRLHFRSDSPRRNGRR